MMKALKNALLATAYIAVVASLLFYGQRSVGPTDSVIMPIAMLSLFTLSAATVGFFAVATALMFAGLYIAF